MIAASNDVTTLCTICGDLPRRDGRACSGKLRAMIERAAENRLESYPFWKIDAFAPDFPAGRIERIYTHWSAYDYRSVYPAYHFCVALDDAGNVVVANTHDIRENMRNVYDDPQQPYAAHTLKRNSFAIGISIMGMQGATPHDFGEYPLTESLIEGLCRVGATIAAYYHIPIDADHVMSHAEAAVHDGYFGSEDDQRWDIARLRALARPLSPQDALDVGEELRERMRRYRP